MKKIYTMILCLFVVMMGIGCVYSANLATHDFGNFTMNVPSDSSFDEVDISNQKVSSDDVDIDLSDVANIHPSWVDNKSGIVIEYFDYEEDGVSGSQVQLDYLDNPMISDPDANGYTVFEEGDEYILIKVNGGHKSGIDNAIDEGGSSLIILKGEDLNTLEEMIETVEFK